MEDAGRGSSVFNRQESGSRSRESFPTPSRMPPIFLVGPGHPPGCQLAIHGSDCPFLHARPCLVPVAHVIGCGESRIGWLLDFLDDRTARVCDTYIVTMKARLMAGDTKA